MLGNKWQAIQKCRYYAIQMNERMIKDKTTKTNHGLNTEKNSGRQLWNQQKPAAQLDNHHQYQLPTANNNANPTPTIRAATVCYTNLLTLQITHEHIHIKDGSATTSQLQSWISATTTISLHQVADIINLKKVNVKQVSSKIPYKIYFIILPLTPSLIWNSKPTN